jgi:hypothetical protein
MKSREYKIDCTSPKKEGFTFRENGNIDQGDLDYSLLSPHQPYSNYSSVSYNRENRRFSFPQIGSDSSKEVHLQSQRKSIMIVSTGRT